MATDGSDTIGCGTHRLAIVDRNGSPRGELTGVSSLTWDRRLNDVSAAAITIEMSDISNECCKILSELEPWRHDLVVYRDEDIVWKGPVVEIEYGQTSVNVIANDVLVWLQFRLIFKDYDFTGNNQEDLSRIAQTLIHDSLGYSDPGFLKFLYVTDAGLIGERAYSQDEAYIYNVLSDLSLGGVNFTALHRRIILGPDESFGHLGRWGDTYFPNGYTIRVSGTDMANRVVVRGGQLDDNTIVEEIAEGPLQRIEYYGRLDRLITDTNIFDQEASTISTSAKQIAIDQSRRSSAKPIAITMETGTLLSPNVPVHINDLVPGSTIFMYSENTCLKVKQKLRLAGISVQDTADEQGSIETVSATFVPIGTEISGI